MVAICAIQVIYKSRRIWNFFLHIYDFILMTPPFSPVAVQRGLPHSPLHFIHTTALWSVLGWASKVTQQAFMAERKSEPRSPRFTASLLTTMSLIPTRNQNRKAHGVSPVWRKGTERSRWPDSSHATDSHKREICYYATEICKETIPSLRTRFRYSTTEGDSNLNDNPKLCH